MSNVITVGSSGKPSAAAQWKTASTQKITASVNDDAANVHGPKIPMNRIKLSSSGMQAATPSGEGDGSKRASSRSGVQRLKVSARPASGQRKVST